MRMFEAVRKVLRIILQSQEDGHEAHDGEEVTGILM